MSVKVDVHLESIRQVSTIDLLLGCVDRRMVFLSRCVVETIQIPTVSIEAPLASRYTVGIEAGDDLEDVVV